MSLHVYLIDDDCELYWISAESEQSARDYYEAEYADESGIAPAELSVRAIPDEQMLTIRMGDAPPGEEKQAKTAGEWAREGAGLVGSTLW